MLSREAWLPWDQKRMKEHQVLPKEPEEVVHLPGVGWLEDQVLPQGWKAIDAIFVNQNNKS